MNNETRPLTSVAGFRALAASPGTATSIGSLPHIDPHAAAEFVLEHHPVLPAIPSLPRRSPFESLVAQAAVGIPGVHIEADGSLQINTRRMDPVAPITTDLSDEAYGAMRGFLEVARGRTEPVKWQACGPITLGFELVRAGAPSNIAFDVATRAVRVRLRALHRAVAEALPGAEQIVFVDEPALVHLMHPCFPVPPDVAIDLVSGVLAGIELSAAAGVHCCGDSDPAALTAIGPRILSLPVSRRLVDAAGYLTEFLAHGGWIAWGVVPTDRPLAGSPERYWNDLAGLWCELVQRGADPVLLRTQALLTPVCGLAMHDLEQAALVLSHTAAIAEKVAEQAVATRLSIGA